MRIAVIGGGLVGLAIADGLARRKAEVYLFDEGDRAFRASNGNFGLVWVQGKGEHYSPYTHLTGRSATLWPDFAAALERDTETSIGYRASGGIDFALSAEEDERLGSMMLHSASELDWHHSSYRRLEPREIEAVFGGSPGHAVRCGYWSAHDGVVNPLYLMHALVRRFEKHGGTRQCHGPVKALDAERCRLIFADGSRQEFDIVVAAAGLGIAPLMSPLGIDVPIRPERGQILVTERQVPLLRVPSAEVRQTNEGTILIGATHENVGLDVSATHDARARLLHRALAIVPALAAMRLVRHWSALRILTPDGAPIYDAPDTYPGLQIVTCHSGVTLAALHAGPLAEAILAGRLAADFPAFGLRRFAPVTSVQQSSCHNLRT